jgi:hypothetical protein
VNPSLRTIAAGQLGADRRGVRRVSGDELEDALGKPGPRPRRAIAIAVSGVCSAGFSTIVQPAASAGADFAAGIAAEVPRV